LKKASTFASSARSFRAKSRNQDRSVTDIAGTFPAAPDNRFKQGADQMMTTLLFILAMQTGAQETPVDSATPAISDLASMSGSWASMIAEPGSGELWMPPAGGTMLGVSRMIRDGKTVEHEFLRIKETEGKIVYIACPSGQAETEFTLVSSGRTKAVFEHPAHDFPQRIIYELIPEGNLSAKIEGIIDGKLKAIDFPMKRTTGK
jgi:hypothetical protein